MIRRVVERVTDRSGRPHHGSAGTVLLGPGDDAAVVRAPDGRVVVTTDLLVEGRHFRRDWSSAYDVGVKAAAQNLADVMAMGARATSLVVGLAAPGDLELSWVEGLADGLAAEAARTGAAVVGGDTVGSDLLIVSVTALGDLEGREPVTRSGARPGDRIGVVGRLGWAEAGLRLLRAGTTTGPLPDAHRRPSPPYDMGPLLARYGATAMLDVSDGLLQDAGHVAAASGVRLDLDLAALRPLGAPGVTDADLLGGGDDHALLCTLPAGHGLPVDPGLPPGVHVVGTVTAGEGVYVDGRRPTGPGGHAHFRAAG